MSINNLNAVFVCHGDVEFRAIEDNVVRCATECASVDIDEEAICQCVGSVV